TSMNEHDKVIIPTEATQQPAASDPVTAPADPSVPAAEPTAALNGTAEVTNRHAEAGRKGARRVHQLMQLGLLYEKEHGLKRGRQRLRQLIQEGRLYEQEHGLSIKPRRPRRDRQASEQVVQSFLRSLVRMVKPAYRDKLRRVLEGLEAA